MYAYLYGQILGTHSFFMKNGFPRPDDYSEIAEKYFLTGGETGTAATVLSSLGINVKIDGTHIGRDVAPMLRDFYKNTNVDISSLLFDDEYEGLQDYVIVSELQRAPMGFFQALYEKGIHRWNTPSETDIAGCSVAAIDPFFLDESLEAAKLCLKHKKPYVTIDCEHTSPIHRGAAINIVSKECLAKDIYANMPKEDVLSLLTAETDGLVIITSGENDMLYSRKGEEIHHMKPFRVPVKSTLGAGDTFKAGCVYALMNAMNDHDLVRFASACSAVAVTRYPLPLYPPRLNEVKKLLDTGDA